MAKPLALRALKEGTAARGFDPIATLAVSFVDRELSRLMRQLDLSENVEIECGDDEPHSKFVFSESVQSFPPKRSLV